MTRSLCDMFFDSDDLAELVTYTITGGTTKSIRVLWFDPYSETTLEGMRVSNAQTSLWARAADVSISDYEATFTRSAKVYTIMEIEPNPDDGGADVVKFTLSATET